jgi:hypothetical protein
MASALSIAVAKQDAIQRIDGHLKRLVKEGEGYTPLPTTGRDPLVLGKDQLVMIADALDAAFAQAEVVDALNGSEAGTEPVTDTPTRAQKTTDDTPARAKSGSAKGTK